MNEKNMTADEVAATWDGSTSLVIRNSLPTLKKDEEDIAVIY